MPNVTRQLAKRGAISDHPPFKVLIVGGGCAALEAAFRLQRVAEGKVDTTILAPDEQFVTQAFAVLVPFAAGHTPHESLAAMASAAGARLRRGRLASVDAAERRVLTEEGETISYEDPLAYRSGNAGASMTLRHWSPSDSSPDPSSGRTVVRLEMTPGWMHAPIGTQTTSREHRR